MFRRVLIANRGEIAVRIARAAAALNIESVSVFAAVDALSLHTRVTTESVPIGVPADDPVRCYLNIEALIAAARSSGCDCLHPGYGFLSESTVFARRCAEEGIVFVGPGPDTLSLFGDKTKARALASSLDVPVVPGSPRKLATSGDAAAAAAKLGYPVMLKAAAGGGGRGLRIVEHDSEMSAAFARCQSEAQSAFGDGSIFVEKFVVRPRHIEVQILGDKDGRIAHLYERDCSVQIRNQKVIEIAPAPGIETALLRRLYNDAVKIAEASRYTNVGTMEFLVQPEHEEYFFIECNPRIQVEHTVTEEVTGVDLVEAQFRLASGATLDEIGLGTQSRIPPPRGYAIQARVVASGVGAITLYKEPSGPGIRVDSFAHLGFVPAQQFDPLFAKLICKSNSTGTYASAVERTVRALGEFHIAGLPTNIHLLSAILSRPEVRAGDVRTSLLAEHPELMKVGDRRSSNTLTFLEQQARATVRNTNSPPVSHATPSLIEARDGDYLVECPVSGTIVEVAAAEGSSVRAGDTLLVISAMKMETALTAPSAGVVTAIHSGRTGEAVTEGQLVATIRLQSEAPSSETPRVYGEDSWASTIASVRALQDKAQQRFAPDTTDPGVLRQRSRGKSTCRERIELLLDQGTFREVGSAAGFVSYDGTGQVSDFTPANHVGGWGKIEGRTTIVCADDFTSRGGHADGAIGQKSRYLDQLSLDFRCPSVRLLDGSSGGGSVAAMVPQQQREGESTARESSGAISAGRPRVAGSGGSFLPGHLGSTLYAEQLSTVPVVNVLLGSVVGIGAAKAVLGHFSVMVRDIAQLFVAGPPVVRHAMGYDVTKEDLGGWHIHCRNGSVDNLAKAEEDAIAQVKRFLSYLPSSAFEAAPVQAPDPQDPFDRREEELFTIVPRKRTTTFDMRRAIRLMADKDSFFEIGPLWGTDQITGFVRFNGYPMGVIASDSRHVNGGALTADGCDKLRRHLDVCDVFHIPILNLIDNPGFAVGIEHEVAGTIRKGGEWMIAFAQVSVPICTVIMRRSFGVAGNNFATPRDRSSARVVWPAADVGGIPPEGGIEAAYKRQLAEAKDPKALRAEINSRIEGARGPLGPLNKFQMEEMIDPRDTRRFVCEWVENAWRVVSQPARLVPRTLQFRP